jgi:MFS family permease
LQFNTAFIVFRSPNFRAAALGYFGHMWELYTFWAFVPFILSLYNTRHGVHLNIPFWSFIIIATGCCGCIAGGLLSRRSGSKKIAFYSLLLSGTCCVLSPLFFGCPPAVFLSILVFWGIMVVADSPQFSTLVAQSAPEENKGTALTIVTCLGFAITIASIQLVKAISNDWKEYSLVLLFAGPLLGLLFLKNYLPAGRQADKILNEQR